MRATNVLPQNHSEDHKNAEEASVPDGRLDIWVGVRFHEQFGFEPTHWVTAARQIGVALGVMDDRALYIGWADVTERDTLNFLFGWLNAGDDNKKRLVEHLEAVRMGIHTPAASEAE